MAHTARPSLLKQLPTTLATYFRDPSGTRPAGFPNWPSEVACHTSTRTLGPGDLFTHSQAAQGFHPLPLSWAVGEEDC